MTWVGLREMRQADSSAAPSRPRLHLVALVCILASLAGTSAAAQVERSVRASDRVRVHAMDGPTVVGVVDDVSRDTLRLRAEDDGTAHIGVPAAALGAAIGASSPLEQWRRVWPAVRVVFIPVGRGGVGVM